MVLLVVLALQAISELVDQLGQMHGAYNFSEVLVYVAFSLPAGIYDYHHWRPWWAVWWGWGFWPAAVSWW